MKRETLIVETNYGPVRGLKRTSAVGDQFFSFQGIPYAMPPTGELRFKDPKPAVPWTEPIDATVAGFSALALNPLTKSLVGNENCLTLNVYTKELSPRKPLPVMVWIHGGGFKYGDSSEMVYGPDYLLAKDIVFCSINYRLGVLGFLSIDDPSANVPGNAGLKDQSMALKWIRENVQYFGGDNKNITVFGESAGAGSVHCHMISNLSKGLFDKAIVQSGCALSPWCNGLRNNWAERIAKKLGWDGASQLINFLTNVGFTDLILAQETLTIEEKRDWIFSEYVPCVEPYVSEQSFFTKSPFETYKSAWGNKIPLIIGGTSEEGLLSYRDIMADPELYKGEKAFQNLIPKEWGYCSDKIKHFADTLRTFYTGEDDRREIEAEKFLNIISDKYFWHGIHLAIMGRLQDVNSAPTYMYRFSFSSDPKFHFIRQFLVPNEVKGVCHGEDIVFLFKPSMINEPTVNSAEHRTIDRLTSIFTRFATIGDPNCDLIKPVYWKPIANRTSPPFKCLNIDDELSFIFYPESKRIAFWISMQS